MTLSRTIALCGLAFLLSNSLAAQQENSLKDLSQLSESQIHMLDTMAVDTTGGALVVPNVFSPNGDGVNDIIEVPTDGVTVYEFIIFSRSGTRVYYSKSPTIFWDGRSMAGQELNTGVYYYVLEEEDGSDPVQKTGFIYLYR